ncbi:hypothetical protein AVEN_104481-1 [Araneus ventricosus]|uniref:Uncharacterized protein n=1 Tax=Araneus ventricosus TaxID=182803 RepID=A0A4Y2R113_ARAVE|nr:hypothetical protein AVEN_104481-1 [Araneus ventricosus]
MTQDHLRAPANHSHLDPQAFSTPLICNTNGCHQNHQDPFKKTPPPIIHSQPQTQTQPHHSDVSQILSDSHFVQHLELSYREKSRLSHTDCSSPYHLVLSFLIYDAKLLKQIVYRHRLAEKNFTSGVKILTLRYNY